MFTREDVVISLKDLLMNHKDVLTIWEGGSKATKRLDKYSDLDLMMVTEKPHTNNIYALLEAHLEEKFGIKHCYKVKEPAWHGFSQRFYELHGTKDYLYLDVCILHPEIKDKFTAVDRHGEAFVWKDTIDFINPTPTPQDHVLKKAHMIYMNACESEFILYNEVGKAIKRNHFIDAFTMTNAYLMRHLVPLLNITYRISQADFGLRYAQTVYSIEDLAMIEQFFKANSIDTINHSYVAFKKRFEALKNELSDFNTKDKV